MKVNVLQVEDVKIPAWRFYSNWVDISIFQCDSMTYLLQMKISRFNGKKFRSIKITGRIFPLPYLHVGDVGDLMPMSKEVKG